MKKKVILLGNHSLVIFNFRKEIIKELLEKGFEVIISLPYDEKVDEMVSWGCKYERIEVDRRGVNPITDAKLLLNYLKLIKKIKPDVVLAYTAKPNVYGGIACRILKVPCVNNVTGLGSGFKKGRLIKFILETLYKCGLKKSKCVFFQNSSDMDLLIERKVVTGQFKLLPGSGVNLSEYSFEELEDSEPRFLFVGRIMRDKGIDQYLEASKAIKGKYPEVQFDLVGFVEETQPHYNDMITKLVDESIIQFHGFQKDVKPFMKKSHCLVQPSYGEGLSNVMLEAGAMGRILIASNIPGCREIIDVGENGFTFSVKNTESLIEQIENVILLDSDKRTSFGVASRKKIEKEFSRSIVIKKYMELINEIV